jgi:hypothetical protein
MSPKSPAPLINENRENLFFPRGDVPESRSTDFELRESISIVALNQTRRSFINTICQKGKFKSQTLFRKVLRRLARPLR